MILLKKNDNIGGDLSCAVYRNHVARAGKDASRQLGDTVISASGQTVTKNACMSTHDAAMSNGSPAEIRAEVEKALAKSGACKLTDFNIDSNSKTETMICGEDTIHNETTFHGGESFETTTTRTKGGVATVAHFKGKRTGECKAN